MTRWLLVGALLVAIGAAAHLVTVWAVPRVIMNGAMRRLSQNAGVNHPAHPPLPTPTSRAVVMPSPDLLYTSCVYDVSETPLAISAQVPPTYWSLSIYAANTDNFFVINDRQAQGAEVRIVLAAPAADVTPPPGAHLVRAPSAKGIVLFRTLVLDPDHAEELVQAQQSMTCAPLAP